MVEEEYMVATQTTIQHVETNVANLAVYVAVFIATLALAMMTRKESLTPGMQWLRRYRAAWIVCCALAFVAVVVRLIYIWS